MYSNTNVLPNIKSSIEMGIILRGKGTGRIVGRGVEGGFNVWKIGGEWRGEE